MSAAAAKQTTRNPCDRHPGHPQHRVPWQQLTKDVTETLQTTVDSNSD